ncbi:MAG: hypothetical protein ACI3ZL_02305 [Candidatus Cryptobacteroides sp.]
MEKDRTDGFGRVCSGLAAHRWGKADMEVFRSICKEEGESPRRMERLMYETFGMSPLEVMLGLSGECAGGPCSGLL